VKAILEFNLDDEDDRRQHALAIQASDVLAALENLDSILRAEYKYKDMGFVDIEFIRVALQQVMGGEPPDTSTLKCVPYPSPTQNED